MRNALTLRREFRRKRKGPAARIAQRSNERLVLRSYMFHEVFSTHIGIIAPSGTPTRSGNAVSAQRWQRILRDLGHRVTLAFDYAGEPFDAILVLHARKGAAALSRFVRDYPERPSILALTGTDLYHDITTSVAAQRSLALASRLVVLQSEGVKAVPRNVRKKTHVIYQSVDIRGAASARPVTTARARPVSAARAPLVSAARAHLVIQSGASAARAVEGRADAAFHVLYVGGLRAVKDPFRLAYASRKLPRTSSVLVSAIGPAYSASYECRAIAEMQRNPRYYWFGEESHAHVLRAIRRSNLVVVSSKSEGGANIIAEAIVAGVPVIASDMPGNRGMLGEDYAGYFPVGDTAALRALLLRTESDRAFHARLRKQCRARASLFTPRREANAWRDLLCNL